MLSEGGIVECQREVGFPGTACYELTSCGRELFAVATVVETWLGGAPGEPVKLGTMEARAMVKALVEGWGSTMARALAARPLSLNELNSLITNLNYPSVERRLRAMRTAGLVQAVPGPSSGKPYAPTDWMRAAIAPLSASARWERRHTPEQTAPIGMLDVETAFLLVVPTLELSPAVSGDCRRKLERRDD